MVIRIQYYNIERNRLAFFYTKNSVVKMVISINLHYSDKKPCLNGKFKEGKVKKWWRREDCQGREDGEKS